MIKKLGLAALSLIIIAVVYYKTTGSAQLTTNMKTEVATQLTSLQAQGFLVEEREVNEKKEHFVISLDETEKITNFLNNQGAQITPQDLEGLKGLKIGVDVTYLADTYSSASFDMYPVALPTSITSASLDADEKQTLKQIEEMIEKKTFLVHVDVNKLGTGFKGYMKDIDEVIKGKSDVKLTMTALKFTGDLKDDTLTGIKQTLKNFTISAADELSAQFTNLTSNYTVTGTTKYDYDTSYTVEKMLFLAEDGFKVQANNLSMDSNSKVNNNLASVTVDTKVARVHYTDNQKTTVLDTLVFDMKANNFDITALEQLETIDPDNDEELLAVFQKLISHGVRFEIPNCSVKEIEFEKQKFEGFKLSTTFDIDKSLDLATLEQNPMAAIGAMDANLHLILSNDLFALIAKQPQAVMAMMLFQPKDINGEKVYKVELKDGALTVNDKPAM